MICGKFGSECDKCVADTEYEKLCIECFTSEVLEMTIKELRLVGKELGVKFGGKTLKADLQNMLVDYKTDTVKGLSQPLIRCTCSNGMHTNYYKDQCQQCFTETILKMTVKEIKLVGNELGVNFGGKTAKADLMRILLHHKEELVRWQSSPLPVKTGRNNIKNDVDKMEANLRLVTLIPTPTKVNKKDVTDEKSIQQLLTQYKSVSALASDVAKSRHDIDLYSKSTISTLESPEVDHIVETQMMAHCASAALKSRAVQFVPDLSHLVNPTNLTNYNICSKSVNISKGQVVRLFLNDTDGLHKDSGIRAKPYYHCYNQMGNITQAWIDTFPEIAEDVRTYRSRTDYVQNGDFEQVATQLDDLFDRMKLLDVEGIVTRSKSKK